MTWKTLNAWAGHVTFGLPAALALPALASTITRFGPQEALTTAAPLALLVWVPFVAWIHHTRRHPTHTVVLVVFATVTTVTYLATPLFFAPVLLGCPGGRRPDVGGHPHNHGTPPPPGPATPPSSGHHRDLPRVRP